MNPINKNKLEFLQQKGIEQKCLLDPKIEGRKLYLCENLEGVTTQQFWEQVKVLLKREPHWDSLHLAPGEIISREMVQEYAQLEMEIPLADLIQLKEKISLENLKEFVKAKLPPLHSAAFLGLVPLMERAFGEGVDLNAVYKNKESSFDEDVPLSLAWHFERYEAFQWLLEKGASSDALISLCHDPLKDGYLEKKPFVQLLIRNNFIQYQLTKGPSSLHEAACAGDKEFLKFLIEEAGISLNLETKHGYTPLVYALKDDQIEVVEYLLSRKAKVDANSIKMALKRGNSDILLLLLRHGTGISSEQLTEICKRLLERDQTRGASLQRAIRTGDTKLVGILLKAGFDVNVRLPGYMTPLHSAAERGEEKMVSFLLENKADINLCDKSGNPILHQLLLTGHKDVLQVCLNCPELDKTACDENGVSFLKRAVCTGDTKLVAMLLDAGFDVNAACLDRITPLHIAADQNNPEMVRLLLDHGADINAETDTGSLPFHFALVCKGYTSSLLTMLRPTILEEVFDPSDICELHQQVRHDFASAFYDKVEDSLKWKVKEKNARKLGAHAFELSGNSEMIPLKNFKEVSSINLEGLFSDQWLHRKIRKQLASLKNDPTFPQDIRQVLEDVCQFSEMSSSKTNAEILQRIQEGKFTSIYTGYVFHAVQFVVHKISETEVLFCVCNRHYPLKLFRMNLSDLTEEMIGKMRHCPQRPKKNYETMLAGVKEKFFKTDEYTQHIEEHYPLEEQKVGNCVYASLEAALWTVIALHYAEKNGDLEAATELFKCLQFDAKLQFAAEYFKLHLQGDNPYFPDMNLSETMFQGIAPYQDELSEQYKELLMSFRYIPSDNTHKETVDCKEKDVSPLVGIELLREKYYT